jgi:hypothetical protein
MVFSESRLKIVQKIFRTKIRCELGYEQHVVLRVNDFGKRQIFIAYFDFAEGA